MGQETLKTLSSCTDGEEFGSIRAEEALQRMLRAVIPISGYEKIPIQDAVGRVLHQAILSPINVPSHTNSAVDGYGIRAVDLPPEGETRILEVIGAALAGKSFKGIIQGGQAICIMTGAPMPENADTVLMQEHVERRGAHILIDSRHRPGQNVRQAGEDIQQGQTVLNAGRLCTPADIGLIASLGIGEVSVKRKLTVALFSTGDEVQAIGEPLRAGGLYDSNRYTLAAMLKRLPVNVLDLGIIPDDRDRLLRAFSDAARDADVVITSGGVSVGLADYTKAVLASLGNVEFWKVAIKPGRPIAFGKINQATFFGLPGNPVAVMVTFYQFVLPALEKCSGIEDRPVIPTLSARSTERIRKKPGRTEYQRGILAQTEQGEWIVRTTGKQGSGILRSMSLANAFIILPHERGTVEPGERVQVQPFAGLM